MASKDGNKTEGLNLLQDIQQHPYRYDFFQAVRRINCAFPESARTGMAYRPGDDPVRFTQPPYTSFAPATLSALDFKGPNGVPRLSQRFLGLFGPNGPLPLHLTEYARDRLHHKKDGALVGFADTFHHRAVSLFYRAWSQGQPTVQRDRPGEDRFSVYMGTVSGFGMPKLAQADDMPQSAKLHFAGHLSSLPRHAEGLVAILEGHFKVPAKIVEFIAHWLTIPKRDRLKLGSNPAIGHLGEDAVLGERVWQRQDKFQIRLGPMSLREYESFLPSGKLFNMMVATVRNFLGLELLWETRPILKGDEKPVTCLGKQGVLGWTSWLESKEVEEQVGDLVLQVANYT